MYKFHHRSGRKLENEIALFNSYHNSPFQINFRKPCKNQMINDHLPLSNWVQPTSSLIATICIECFLKVKTQKGRTRDSRGNSLSQAQIEHMCLVRHRFTTANYILHPINFKEKKPDRQKKAKCLWSERIWATTSSICSPNRLKRQFLWVAFTSFSTKGRIMNVSFTASCSSVMLGDLFHLFLDNPLFFYMSYKWCHAGINS